MARRKVKSALADVAAQETGVIRKHRQGRICIALVYPNTYGIGMTNLGFQAVYRLLNQRDDVVCERAFLAPKQGANPNDGVLRTLESGRAIAEFDIIAFSISFEADYLNLTAIVLQAGLPLRSAARGDPHPLVIAGGVACFLNPEPVAPFIDCFFIGEAEVVLPLFFQFYKPELDRRECLRRIAVSVPGIYVPDFYPVTYHADGSLRGIEPVPGLSERIMRVRPAALADCATCSSVLSPQTSFGDTFLIEVSRGCAHGCRFCAAGFVYRPARIRPVDRLRQDMAKGAELSRKIGLVGAAVSDYPELERLCEYAIEKGLTVSFSSLRADALTPALAEVLRKSGVKTATIAPDAGSEHLRRVINKGIREEQIHAAVDMLVSAGIPNLKLYFMIGLPFETDGDVEEIVGLCERIKAVFLSASRKMKRIGTITVSINPFIPKPFTPFQWAAMDNEKTLKAKSMLIQSRLARTANLTVQVESIRQAFIQAVLARGDRRVADLLEAMAVHGLKWTAALKAWGMDPDFYTLRQRSMDEVLPWDFIDHGIKKSFLAEEYRLAQSGKSSPSCPVMTDMGCKRCGVCAVL